MTHILDNPFDALGPIKWDSVDKDDLDTFLTTTFSSAQAIVDSIPTAAAGGRARAQTDAAVSYASDGGVVGNDTTNTAEASSSAASADTAEEKTVLLEKKKQIQKIQQEWKEVRVGGANPREIAVYKYAGSRNGYGGSSWFARRSIHRKEKIKKGKDGEVEVSVSFDKFKAALQNEFRIQGKAGPDSATTGDDEDKNNNDSGESTKGKDGQGNVRTMVAKKHAEHIVVDGSEAKKASDEDAIREVNVYLLEAVFPGPTTARDFVTMVLTSSSRSPATAATSDGNRPRQFMVVSKPCAHPDLLPRQGFVRAEYESVELIREIPVARNKGKKKSAKPLDLRQTRSSVDLALHSDGGGSTGQGGADRDADTDEMAIEWLMITRNNPGGSVPRFLVDKSTPSSIISDANKFIDWLVLQGDAGEAPYTLGNVVSAKENNEEGIKEENDEESSEKRILPNILPVPPEGGAASSARLYNLFAGALGAAGSAVVSRLPNPFDGAAQAMQSNTPGGYPDENDHSDSSESDTFDDDDDDNRSARSGPSSALSAGASASSLTLDAAGKPIPSSRPLGALSDASAASLISSTGDDATSQAGGLAADSKAAKAAQAAMKRHERELRKLHERQRKAEEAVLKAKKIPKLPEEEEEEEEEEGAGAGAGRDRDRTDKDDDVASSTSSLAAAKSEIQKLREKHERAVARQQARYEKETQKLERKQQRQAEKAAAQLRKQQERKEKADASLQLAHARAERDVARKEVELLTEQVRQLQAQNTMLAAKLGKQGKLAKADKSEDVLSGGS